MAERRSPKSKAVGSIPSSLAVHIDLINVEKWEQIPDSYIIENYIFSEHRIIKKGITNFLPLFATFIERLKEKYDIDVLDSGPSPISPQMIMDTITELFPYDNAFSLFNRAYVYRNEDMFELKVKDVGYESLSACEVVLCKEEASYESDEKLIARLKKSAFVDLKDAREKLQIETEKLRKTKTNALKKAHRALRTKLK